ncbi:STAS domain-containing protein [Motilibacter deserti]|uniref:Anti-sigma factor antagonist n=1 Tax=Motilibacter deserti TaxID=2714956 RepID=A0ABX0GUU3_9ACTN|nr:STAS domain-containing protein [Motilibacter deserti]NHC14288.1 STAS domain-containing protein [Motilibacter deserti]
MTILGLAEPGPDAPQVLHASGELDAATVPALLEQVPDLLAGACGVVLDLRDVTFFDSSGVRLVDVVARQCARRGVPVAAVAPPGHLARRVLEMVGMAESFVVDGIDEAFTAVRRG